MWWALLTDKSAKLKTVHNLCSRQSGLFFSTTLDHNFQKESDCDETTKKKVWKIQNTISLKSGHRKREVYINMQLYSFPHSRQLYNHSMHSHSHEHSHILNIPSLLAPNLLSSVNQGRHGIWLSYFSTGLESAPSPETNKDGLWNYCLCDLFTFSINVYVFLIPFTLMQCWVEQYGVQISKRKLIHVFAITNYIFHTWKSFN